MDLWRVMKKIPYLLLSFVMGLSQPLLGASFLTGGHIDGPAFGYDTAGGFEPHYHNEGGPDGAIIGGTRVTAETEYEPDELIVFVRPTSTITLGTTTYYWLPETEAAADANNVPFIGLGLEELTPEDWLDGTVSLTLLSVTGPGDFRLWQDDGFGGANDFLNPADGKMSFDIAAGTHTHYNRGFTELGEYALEFEISGTHLVDGPQSGSASYFYAVPEPSSALLLVGGMLLGLRRRR